MIPEVVCRYLSAPHAYIMLPHQNVLCEHQELFSAEIFLIAGTMAMCSLGTWKSRNEEIYLERFSAYVLDSIIFQKGLLASAYHKVSND